jgi:UDP-3-O-[3-hydroxymyristoyl] glucosamine N-acyltransferase
MEFTIQQVALMLGGTVQGDSEAFIHNLGKIQDAQKGDIAFLSNPKYESFIYTTQASAVIVNKGFVTQKPLSTSLILVEDAYTAFSVLLEEYEKLIKFSKKGFENPHFVAENVVLGENLYIGAFAYIGKNVKIGNNCKIYPQTYIGDNVTIGENTIIYAGTRIYENCKIGNNCTLHSGVVIGSDGFGFAPQPDGSYKTIPQVGNVILEDNVSVGSNSTIDRATMGSTVICKGVKIDNLVQIAHNVIIGKDTVIAAQTGIAGSSELGEGCMVGGQVGIGGHIKLADKTYIGGQSGVGKSIQEAGKKIQGSLAFDILSFHKSSVLFRKLPEIMQKINVLETKIIDLANNKIS